MARGQRSIWCDVSASRKTAGQNVRSFEQQSLISTIGKDTDHRRCTLLSHHARRDFATAYDGSVVRGAIVGGTIVIAPLPSKAGDIGLMFVPSSQLGIAPMACGVPTFSSVARPSAQCRQWSQNGANITTDVELASARAFVRADAMISLLRGLSAYSTYRPR